MPLKEFELLELLLRNAGRVLTRGQLIDRVWGSDYFGDTKTLDVHIKRIRSRIEEQPVGAVHARDGARARLPLRGVRTDALRRRGRRRSGRCVAGSGVATWRAIGGHVRRRQVGVFGQAAVEHGHLERDARSAAPYWK